MTPAALSLVLLLSAPIQDADGNRNGNAPEDAPELTVEIEGVQDELRENVRQLLTIERAAEGEEDVPVARIQRMHRQAEDEIRLALEPFGYYRPEVAASLRRNGELWQARYVIRPGEPITVEEADIRLLGEGSDDPALRRAIDEFPVREGDRLFHPAYEEGKERLQFIAAELGYLDARFTRSRIEVDLERYAARIILHYDVGARHRFGAVEFEQDAFDREFLERFVPFDPADPYSTAQLLELQNALTDSDYFRSVEVESLQDETDELRVPIRVTLVPKRKARYGVGVGYGTDTGPRGTLQLLLGRLTRSGHRLQSEARASFLQRQTTVKYIIPVGGRWGDEVAFTAGYQGLTFSDNSSRLVLLGTSLAHARGGWRETLSLNFAHEWFDIGSISGTAMLILPSAAWSNFRANDPIFPTRGHRLLAELRGTAREIGSGVSFSQLKITGHWVRSPYDRGRVLARATLGGTVVDAFRDLPGSMRFFAGGDRSVRGFAFQSLGPRGPAGRPTGGRWLLTSSLEYEHRFLESWGAAVFVDAGNVARDIRDFDLEYAAGIGARWISPIGLARLDLAGALSRSGLPLRIHFTIGPDL